MHYEVSYRYDGGRDSVVVDAMDAETATATVMATATARWNPGAAVHHVRTERLLADADRTVEAVVDMVWDRRDRGGRYLIVERGTKAVVLPGLPGPRTVWYTSARLVGTARTPRGAARVATIARRRLRRLSALIDIVERDSVQMCTSDVPYGCISGEGIA